MNVIEQSLFVRNCIVVAANDSHNNRTDLALHDLSFPDRRFVFKEVVKACNVRSLWRDDIIFTNQINERNRFELRDNGGQSDCISPQTRLLMTLELKYASNRFRAA